MAPRDPCVLFFVGCWLAGHFVVAFEFILVISKQSFILRSYILHSFDGYSEKDISEMGKNKPEVRSRYGEYVLANRKLKERLGQRIERPSFSDILG